CASSSLQSHATSSSRGLVNLFLNRR
ncbi:hypothetical protein V3C99_005432, partial [Haemonchus contortus]